MYVSDRKSRTLLTSPYHVTALVDQEEVQLKFTAPRWPGVYTFTVCLRSDSYLGFDQTHDIKVILYCVLYKLERKNDFVQTNSNTRGSQRESCICL